MAEEVLGKDTFSRGISIFSKSNSQDPYEDLIQAFQEVSYPSPLTNFHVLGQRLHSFM
jgi:predicted neuraminidase